MSVIRAREAHEPKIIKNGEPVIVAEMRIGALVQYPVLRDEGNGYVAANFEKYVRSPGTRIIAVKDNMIFLQQEVRLEKNNIPDWRLPGGKVVDSFEEYKQYMGKDIPMSIIVDAAAKELHEEAHLKAGNFSIFTKKECGATVEWDLYYVVAKDVSEAEELVHNEGEENVDSGWFSFDQVMDKCKKGDIGEGRSVAVLLEFITQNT